MTLADADYATEARAYETIQAIKGMGRKLVPEYYGAWSFSVPTNRADHLRGGRMILLQLVPGKTVLAKIENAKEHAPRCPASKFVFGSSRTPSRPTSLFTGRPRCPWRPVTAQCHDQAKQQRGLDRFQSSHCVFLLPLRASKARQERQSSAPIMWLLETWASSLCQANTNPCPIFSSTGSKEMQEALDKLGCKP